MSRPPSKGAAVQRHCKGVFREVGAGGTTPAILPGAPARAGRAVRRGGRHAHRHAPARRRRAAPGETRRRRGRDHRRRDHPQRRGLLPRLRRALRPPAQPQASAARRSPLAGARGSPGPPTPALLLPDADPRAAHLHRARADGGRAPRAAHRPPRHRLRRDRLRPRRRARCALARRPRPGGQPRHAPADHPRRPAARRCAAAHPRRGRLGGAARPDVRHDLGGPRASPAGRPPARPQRGDLRRVAADTAKRLPSLSYESLMVSSSWRRRRAGRGAGRGARGRRGQGCGRS
jgi:hypothetical protein